MELSDKRIEESIEKYYSLINKDEYARYKSWEHCYLNFAKAKDCNDDETIDYLSLHLAFYLASWGMLRNSFLLEKDYRVHIPAIKILKKDEYKFLYGISIDKFLDGNNILSYLKLIDELRTYYKKQKDTVKTNDRETSDTLITKVLLGVFGCVPAFDRYFTQAITDYNIAEAKIDCLGPYKKLIEFYNQHKNLLENKREQINKNGIIYPQMKMLDILFWQVGFDDEIEKKKKSKGASK